MDSVIYKLTTEQNNVNITGMLLMYPNCFICLVETYEEIIFRYLKEVFEDKEFEINFGTVIHLPVYYHAHQRFFTGWFTTFTKPPTLLDKLDASGIDELQKQMSNCVSKVYNLCEYIVDTRERNQVNTEEILNRVGELVPQYLPESTVLEFLLKSKAPVLTDIREYLKCYTAVPFISFYNDKIWPAPGDLMPRDVFSVQAPRKN
ncbi:testis-expressed protein 47 isoform X2 [Orussus abietinus]|nr:testis-expressed protein 47 isoform X2 [Orussus abietinus]